MRVKICGLRRLEDAAVAVDAGADALGFNFWKRSPRYIEPSEAARIIADIPASVLTVGVFVDESPERLLEIAAETGIAAVQLHGSETPEYLDRLGSYVKIKAVRVNEHFQPEQLSPYRSASLFLLDGFAVGVPGGTGRTFDWSLAGKAKAYGKIILAGGLDQSNVAEAVRRVRPWGVDVCSGVEVEPGKKDLRLIREFLAAARSADPEEDDEDLPAHDSTLSKRL